MLKVPKRKGKTPLKSQRAEKTLYIHRKKGVPLLGLYNWGKIDIQIIQDSRKLSGENSWGNRTPFASSTGKTKKMKSSLEKRRICEGRAIHPIK